MDTSPKTLGDYSKPLLELLKKLRDAEVQEEVELPRIVAVGAQSAGKSSVIEAISTLKLPRGGGTCTRCPMEFRLQHSTDSSILSVDITLRFASGVVPFQSDLSDLNEIRRAIAEAQESILRGTSAIRGVSARTFSEDCVCVFAKGPNMPNLYFYDIPGVINDVSGDAQDPKQIDLIKNLVKEYVSKKNCIILLVVSCDYDWEIGGVPSLIFKESDPELKMRTVGVLTKVDRIAEGTGPAWLEAFDNKKCKLKHGWFAVKLPAAGDIPWERARQEECEWFENQELWKPIQGEDRNRLGSEQLTKYITRVLSNLVAERLPEIFKNITDKIYSCDAKLELLPRHADRDASETVRTAIDKFSADFAAHVEGIPPPPFTKDVGLVYQVKQLYATIMDGVSERTPRFCPTNRPDDGTSSGSSPSWAQLCADGEIVYLDQMMEYIKLAVTRELPGELPYGIVPTIITYYVNNWKEAAMTVFCKVREVAVIHLNALVQVHFADFERGGLLSSIQKILDDNIELCKTATVDELQGLTAMELVPATVLEAEYTNLQDSIRKQYQPRELTQEPDDDISLSTVAANVLGTFLVNNGERVVSEIADGVISLATRQSFIDQFATSGQRRRNSSITNLHRSTVDRDRDNALTVMSSAQAYLELASKRFADVAANFIDHSFLRKLDKGVRMGLRALPANTSDEICLALVRDPSVEEERRSLTEQRNHYSRVKGILDEAKRDLEMDSPGLHARTASQPAAPDTRPQSNPDSGTLYTPFSVDCSSPSLTDISFTGSE